MCGIKREFFFSRSEESRISRDCFFPDPKDSCKAATGSQVIITLLYELSQVLSRLKSARATKHRIIKRASSLPWPDNERMEHVCRSVYTYTGKHANVFDSRSICSVGPCAVEFPNRVNFDRFSPMCIYIYRGIESDDAIDIVGKQTRWDRWLDNASKQRSLSRIPIRNHVEKRREETRRP